VRKAEIHCREKEFFQPEEAVGLEFSPTPLQILSAPFRIGNLRETNSWGMLSNRGAVRKVSLKAETAGGLLRCSDKSEFEMVSAKKGGGNFMKEGAMPFPSKSEINSFRLTSQ
jgi:hypothetical protein